MVSRPRISKVVFVVALSLGLIRCIMPEATEAQPNIIVFLVDDMGLMDASVPFLTDEKGNPVFHPLNQFYQTPHLEQLAKKGIRFSNFYAHSVCSPSRISILTGKNAARHGTTNWIYSERNNRTDFGPSNWNWEGLNQQSVTLPRLLQQAGYRTIHIGKSHLGPFGFEGEDPLNLGFDINIAGSSIGHPGSYYGEEGYGHLKGQKERAVPGLEKYHGSEIFLTEALTQEASMAISKAVEEGKPFFLNLSHYAVHAPFQSDPRFSGNYEDSDKSEKAQAYATLVEGIDQSLGDVIAHLEELGVADNTLVIFLGDNGSDAPLPIEDDYSSSSPLKGKKGNHWEGGMRVPFVTSWAAVNENRACQQATPIASNVIQPQHGNITDLFLTLTQVAEVEVPDDHITDGFKLQGQLNGELNEDRAEVFLNHFPHGNHRSNYFTSLVKSEWKLIYRYQIEGDPTYELYDLDTDPFESNNLADQDSVQLKIMMKFLLQEMKNKNALLPEKDGQLLELILPR